MNSLQRYQWEDYWIKCSTLGFISKREVGTALRLSMQVNWTPKQGKSLGLNWANDLAAASVGIPRSTFRKHLKSLKEAGCFIVIKGNLVPHVGDDRDEVDELFAEFVGKQKHRHLGASIDPRVNFQVSKRDHESHSEISESRKWTPLTEDLCTEDLCTEDLCTEDLDASHPPFRAAHF